MKIVNLILTIILVISIPVSIICLANNLTTRMPDLYQYELKSTEILNDLAVEKNEDEMGQFFSDYMLGKTEKFQIEYQFGENTDNLFTSDEQKTMEKFKSSSNLILFAGLIALFFSLVSYFLIYKQNLKALLRRTFLKAAILFAAFVGAITLATCLSPLIKIQYAFLFDYEIKTFLVLPKLLPESFFIHSALTTVGISIIMMLIIGYFTWKITKSRRIFGTSR
ncbi:MAG: hypothetical protein JJE49_04760 [Peptostreptococcaceae bacterium]|nr:hypothetical protein [Peptostreptococcaceae bacterium]